MRHENGIPGRDPDGQPLQLGVGHSIRPGTAVPSTLLIADMVDGSMLLKSWPDGPSAYLCQADAPSLKRALAAAFSSTEPASR